VVLPAPVCPTMARVWPGSMRKETSRRTQSSSPDWGWAVTEPNIAKFDFAARMFEANGVGGAETVAGSSSSLKCARRPPWRIAGC